jgi:invasion protein IalB
MKGWKTAMTYRTGLRLVLASFLLAATVAAKAQQPDVKASPPAAGAADSQPTWSSQCSAEGRSETLDCAVVHRLFITNTGQLIGSVTIRMPGDTKEPVMMIQTPLGLFLPAGVSIDVDEKKPQRLELQTCDENGCYAGSPVSDDLLAKMRRGQKFNIGFQNLNKQQINLQLSLVGFGAAFDKIK